MSTVVAYCYILWLNKCKTFINFFIKYQQFLRSTGLTLVDSIPGLTATATTTTTTKKVGQGNVCVEFVELGTSWLYT